MSKSNQNISGGDLAAAMQAARELKQQKAYSEALALLSPRLEMNAGKAELQQLVGELCLSLQPPDFIQAESCFNDAHVLRPAWIAPMMSLGRLARQRGDPSTALNWFKKVAAQEPGHLGALRQSAGVLLELKHFDEAEQLLAGGLDANPNDLEMARMMVRLLLETDRPQRAELLARRVLISHPKDRATWFELFRALRKQKKPDELLRATADAVRLLPEVPAILGERMEQLRLSGDYEAAMDCARALREHLSAAPGNIAGWGQLQLDMGRFEHIAKLLSEVSLGSDALKVQALLLGAKAAQRRGDFKAAMADLYRVLLLKPDHLGARNLLGYCLFSVFDLEGIAKHFHGQSAPEWLHQVMLTDLKLYPEAAKAMHDAVTTASSGRERAIAVANVVAGAQPNSATAFYWLQQLAHEPDIFQSAQTQPSMPPPDVIQYWNGVPPDDVAASMETWKKIPWLTGYRLFDRQTACERLKSYCGDMTQKEFDSLSPVIQADLLRLLLLYEDGGIWANADCMVRRVPPRQFFSGSELTLVLDEQGLISTSIIAASPGNSMIGTALEFALDAALSQPEMWHVMTSGTMAISMACAQHLGREMAEQGCIRSTTLYRIHEVRPYLSLNLRHEYHRTRHIPHPILERLSAAVGASAG